MAVFGVPVAHEDDPERAVRAGLAGVARVRERNAAGRRRRLPEVHAGVNTGEATVAPMTSEPSGFAVIGDAVNVASRIAGLAPPGHVLAGEQTVELSRHAIRFGRRRLRRVKGKPEAVPVFEALAPRSAFPARRVSSGGSSRFGGRAYFRDPPVVY